MKDENGSTKLTMQDLVQKISLLRNIEPRNSWVIFAKRKILAGSLAEGKDFLAFGKVGHVLSVLRYLEKPAYAFVALAFVVTTGIGYQISQNSLPGDALYSVRSTLEKATTSSDPLASLQVAQRRLEDLKKVVEENRVRNLSSATQEFSQSVVEASRGLLELVEKEPSRALQASRELVQLQKDKAQIEQILGAEIGGEELAKLESTTKVLVEVELNDLLLRTLTKDQEELVEEAIIAYQAGDYETALEKIWEVSNR